MKKVLIALLIIIVIAGLIMFLPDLASAQPPPPPDKPDQAPIDGGLGLLAAAGGAYAIKKMRDKKK
ncbi:MAG: hypothetical protein JJU37_15310 [Balneolaceae bacterium]|nr:hypothetical protein [Balneolaceae bacterium]